MKARRCQAVYTVGENLTLQISGAGHFDWAKLTPDSVREAISDFQDRRNPENAEVRETPEEFFARTGKRWNDHSAVYMRIGEDGTFRIKSYLKAGYDIDHCERYHIPYEVYCANSDNGIPLSKDEGEAKTYG